MNTTNSALATNRCQHRTRSGRQCRSTITSPGSSLCAHHIAMLSSDSIDFSADLIHDGEHFQQAQQINHSLIALYKLVAAGRISPRRASVLAYIAHLILNTHKAIDYDNKTRGRRRIVDPALRPVMLTIAEAAGFGGQPACERTQPLPATAEEFAAEVAKRSRTTTS